MNLMQLQLDHEITMYKKIIHSGRNDAIAKMVRNSIEKKILQLRREINGATNKENIAHVNSSEVSHGVDEAGSGYRYERNKDYHSIPSIYSFNTN